MSSRNETIAPHDVQVPQPLDQQVMGRGIYMGLCSVHAQGAASWRTQMLIAHC